MEILLHSLENVIPRSFHFLISAAFKVRNKKKKEAAFILQAWAAEMDFPAYGTKLQITAERRGAQRMRGAVRFFIKTQSNIILWIIQTFLIVRAFFVSQPLK